jgi:hypothetical protein
MAFTPETKNGRVVLSETTALANATTANSAAFRVAEGASFIVFGNVGATNTAAGLTAEIQGSFDGVTWVTITSSALTAMDTALDWYLYDADTLGDFPYYRVQYTSAGDDSSATAITKIVGNVNTV